MASVIIPAHNEDRVIGRLLDALTPDEGEPRFEVVVVCNGCSDGTEAVARRFPGVRVLVTESPGKSRAMRMGNAHAQSFPRAYVDADVEITWQEIETLFHHLESTHSLAAAPERSLPLDKSTWPVRAFYELWQDLPHVEAGLFGRGVVALSQAGVARLEDLPDFIADDLAASSLFEPGEREIVRGATVTVHPPRSWSDLVARRIRASAGTTQFYTQDVGAKMDSRTSPGDLLQLLRERPSHLLRLPVFIACALAARRGAARMVRANDYGTWLRDDSSRQ